VKDSRQLKQHEKRLSKIVTVNLPLGTGHKVTARMGRSDLGSAMENLWAVAMGRQFFCMSTVGPPNKNPCMSTSQNKDINNKSKQNYPNYQMQMMY
jgi:hypothetical protein